MNALKFCKDCKHVEQIDLPHSPNTLYYCRSLNLENVDLVTGETFEPRMQAYTARSTETRCGRNANWFEPNMEV